MNSWLAMDFPLDRFEVPSRVTISLKFGPFDFGEVVFQALVANLRPEFFASSDVWGWRLAWKWHVPCRDSGRPIPLGQSEIVAAERLRLIDRETFVRFHVFEPHYRMLTHELDESLLIGGKFFREPHPHE